MGLLHRAFTVAIRYQDELLLQYRKHPVFDQVFDVSISSHPIYKEDVLQKDLEAIYDTLKREWDFTQEDILTTPVYKGKVQYKARDSRSEYIEHEICHIFECEVKTLKLPNLECAYGFCLKKNEDIRNPFDPIYPLLAPWVHAAIEKNLL